MQLWQHDVGESRSNLSKDDSVLVKTTVRGSATLRTGPPRKKGARFDGDKNAARAQDPAWRFGGSLRVAANAVVKFTIARINRRDNDYYFRAACPSLSRGSRRFADRRISWSVVVQAFVRVRADRPTGPIVQLLSRRSLEALAT